MKKRHCENMKDRTAKVFDYLCSKENNLLGIAEINKETRVDVPFVRLALKFLQDSGDLQIVRINGKKTFVIKKKRDESKDAR